MSQLTYASESLLIAMLKVDSRLSGKTIVHFVPPTSAAASLGIITVECTQGPERLDCKDIPTGRYGYDVEATIEYRCKGDEDASVAENIEQGIRDAIFQGNGSGLSEKDALSYFCIEPEAEGSRENHRNSRDRRIKIPLIALSKVTSETDFIVTENGDFLVTENGDFMVTV